MAVVVGVTVLAPGARGRHAASPHIVRSSRLTVNKTIAKVSKTVSRLKGVTRVRIPPPPLREPDLAPLSAIQRVGTGPLVCRHPGLKGLEGA